MWHTFVRKDHQPPGIPVNGMYSSRSPGNGHYRRTVKRNFFSDKKEISVSDQVSNFFVEAAKLGTNELIVWQRNIIIYNTHFHHTLTHSLSRTCACTHTHALTLSLCPPHKQKHILFNTLSLELFVSLSQYFSLSSKHAHTHTQLISHTHSHEHILAHLHLWHSTINEKIFLDEKYSGSLEVNHVQVDGRPAQPHGGQVLVTVKELVIKVIQNRKTSITIQQLRC